MKDSKPTMGELAARSSQLEAEYRSLGGSERPEDVLRSRVIQRELEKITNQYLEAADGPRVRSRSGSTVPFARRRSP